MIVNIVPPSDRLPAASDTAKTSAALLLSAPKDYKTATKSCAALHEDLWSPSKQDFDAGLNASLAYEIYSGRFARNQLYWIASEDSHGGWPTCQAIDAEGSCHQMNCRASLPTLCTQSAPASNITFANTSASFQVAQSVGSQTLVGYRDFLTFRFMVRVLRPLR